VTAQLWIWLGFVFAFGACIGSFLNVVIYRMPRDLSLVYPSSACPKCSKPIMFYDNIPLFSWLLLGAKCRNCRAPISPRYFVIELLTGLMYVGLFWLYFMTGIRQMSTAEAGGMQIFLHGAWLIYLLHIILLSGLLAVSAIDLEFWVVPLSACWFLTVVGVIGATLAPYVIDIREISYHQLLPLGGATWGAISAGAGIGLAISLVLRGFGVLKESYIGQDAPAAENAPEPQYDHRREMLKEALFVMPVIVCSVAAYYLLIRVPAANARWLNITQLPVASGFLGALMGYFVGGAIVWATRIFGTLGFGKEAMGMGDVHLMGAAGAFLGPIPTVVAFFVAPFFGLAWAVFQMFFKKTRQIPYVPFLSLGILTVMIFHDWIFQHLRVLMVH
jgi:leader peptidase (prepilin peptidase)/N-methyltransferase